MGGYDTYPYESDFDEIEDKEDDEEEDGDDDEAEEYEEYGNEIDDRGRNTFQQRICKATKDL